MAAVFSAFLGNQSCILEYNDSSLDHYTNRLKSNHALDPMTFFSILKFKLRIEKNISMKNKNTHFDKFSRVFEAIPP